MPERIQLKRTKGWRMPANTVKCDRSTRWGNPFKCADPAESVARYRHALIEMGAVTIGCYLITPAEIKKALRGKNLACWCKPGKSCHTDILLEIANG